MSICPDQQHASALIDSEAMQFLFGIPPFGVNDVQFRRNAMA
jgi:hypothetical protein